MNMLHSMWEKECIHHRNGKHVPPSRGFFEGTFEDSLNAAAAVVQVISSPGLFVFDHDDDDSILGPY